MTKSLKREQLVSTALELFSKYGFHAVGIDTIIKESGVAKKTLYNHFKSKEELILATLRYHDQLFRNHFAKAVESKGESPREKLLAVFDVAEEWFSSDNFYGCIFIGASSEFPEINTPLRNVCKDFKRMVQEYIQKLAEQAEMENSAQLAAHLVLLLEGAISMAQINNSSLSAKQAKEAALMLIEAHSTATPKH